jgi:hypothetical protein
MCLTFFLGQTHRKNKPGPRAGGATDRTANRYVRVNTHDENEKRQLDGQVLDSIFDDVAWGRDTPEDNLRSCYGSPAMVTA